MNWAELYQALTAQITAGAYAADHLVIRARQTFTVISHIRIRLKVVR